MTQILIFPGSRRKQSYNRMLASYLGSLMPAEIQVDFLAPEEVSLPLYDQDLEADEEIVAHALAHYTRFGKAQGVIVASPEYNGLVSPYLKNTMDWLSRIPRIKASETTLNPFLHKPLLLSSASTGWTGGLLGLQSARTLFSYLGCLVMPGQICVSAVEEQLFGDFFAFSDDMESHIQLMVGHFLQSIARV